MNGFSGLIDTQWLGIVGAIAIAALTLRLLLKLFNQEAKTILALVAIVLLWQFVFGISPRDLWFEISHLPQAIARLAQQFG